MFRKRNSCCVTLTLLIAVLLSIGASKSSADIIVFSLQWSGVTFGNNATASGMITMDTALQPNPGTTGAVPFGNGFSDFTMTVVGSSSAADNVTFSSAAFSDVEWDSGNGGTASLDLTTELVGQATGGAETWGTPSGSGGEFNVFAPGAAPDGTAPFTLTLDGSGDQILLVSFAPVPVPEPTGLLLLGLIATGVVVRRRTRSLQV